MFVTYLVDEYERRYVDVNTSWQRFLSAWLIILAWVATLVSPMSFSSSAEVAMAATESRTTTPTRLDLIMRRQMLSACSADSGWEMMRFGEVEPQLFCPLRHHRVLGVDVYSG